MLREPGTSSENSVSDTFPLGGKTNYLIEDGFPFLVHSANSLENDRPKIVIKFLKTSSVPIDFLVLGIRFTKLQLAKMGGRERTDDAISISTKKFPDTSCFVHFRVARLISKKWQTFTVSGKLRWTAR